MTTTLLATTRARGTDDGAKVQGQSGGFRVQIVPVWAECRQLTDQGQHFVRTPFDHSFPLEGHFSRRNFLA